MRIRVKDVLEMLAEGATQEEILDFPDLEAADIRASLAYAARSLDRRSVMRFRIDGHLSARLAFWFGEEGFSATAVRFARFGRRQHLELRHRGRLDRRDKG
jgi:hypothetical protein